MYYTATQLKDLPRDKILTKETLLKFFTEEEVENSTYTNKLGTYIRLFNSHESADAIRAKGLYSYDKDYIVHFQEKYSNVGAFGIEVTGSPNRKLDAMISTVREHEKDTRVNPPLPNEEV